MREKVDKARGKFKVGDRVKIDMSRTAMNALNWNGQIGTIEAAQNFCERNWWVRLDKGGTPNFKEKELRRTL